MVAVIAPCVSIPAPDSATNEKRCGQDCLVIILRHLVGGLVTDLSHPIAGLVGHGDRDAYICQRIEPDAVCSGAKITGLSRCSSQRVPLICRQRTSHWSAVSNN